MNRIAASILLFAFLAQTFNQGILYLDYLVDKAEYMRKCVNKARPQMECNGKCLLMQRIKEREKKEQENTPQLKMTEKAEIISSKSFFPLCIAVIADNKKANRPSGNSGHPVDRPSSFFHPPDC